MVAWQEELDWLTYELVGLLPGDSAARAAEDPDRVPSRAPEQRAYREPKSDPVRADVIRSVPEVALIESPEYKRRWFRAAGAFDADNVTDDMLAEGAAWRVLRERCEQVLATELRRPTEIDRMIKANAGAGAAAAVLRRELGKELISEALSEDAVPFLSAYRHTESGHEKRNVWQRVWDLQRAEDRGEKVPPFEPPPKYDQKDYREAVFWRLRGKLDVPKERFISYPGCESDEDKEPVYGWAGWNHLQRAIALATLYLKRKQGEAWANERLIPMLAGLDELLPWIWQWHPDATPDSGGMNPGQYIADFLSAQCQELGVTIQDLRAWRPESKQRKKAASAEVKEPSTRKRRSARTEEEETA
jgi:hypothetical protein